MRKQIKYGIKNVISLKKLSSEIISLKKKIFSTKMGNKTILGKRNINLIIWTKSHVEKKILINLTRLKKEFFFSRYSNKLK